MLIKGVVRLYVALLVCMTLRTTLCQPSARRQDSIQAEVDLLRPLLVKGFHAFRCIRLGSRTSSESLPQPAGTCFGLTGVTCFCIRSHVVFGRRDLVFESRGLQK